MDAWIEQSITNNEELFTSLVSQSDVDSYLHLRVVQIMNRWR